MELIVWLTLSLLFYVVCYMAVLNLLDDIIKNSYLKMPLMMAASIPSALLMAVLNYRPIFLFALIAFTNYHRVQQKLNSKASLKKTNGLKLDSALFYSSSYCYIILMCVLAYYFQMPIDLGDKEVSLWKTWFPEGSTVE